MVSSERNGECSLEHYEHMSNDDIKQDLARFKGIGPKTVACVLMFGLKRAEFPVDTHVVSVWEGCTVWSNGVYSDLMAHFSPSLGFFFPPSGSLLSRSAGSLPRLRATPPTCT